MVTSFLEWEIQGIEPSVQYGGSASRLWGLLGQSWSSCQRQGSSQPDTGKILIRKSRQDQLAVHCTLLWCDGSSGVSPLHLASVWFLPKLLREVIPSRSSRVSSVYSSAWHLIAPWITGVCTLGWLFWFLLLLVFLVYVLSAIPFSSFSSTCFQGKLLSEEPFAAFLLVAFFKLRGFAFDEWKWNESANHMSQTGLSMSKGNGC